MLCLDNYNDRNMQPWGHKVKAAVGSKGCLDIRAEGSAGTLVGHTHNRAEAGKMGRELALGVVTTRKEKSVDLALLCC